MSWLVDVRKLAAVDMAWLGVRVILAEYAFGVLLPLALGALSLRSGLRGTSGAELLLGVWLLAIAANYVPLFLYALAIARAGSVEQEGRPEIARAHRYGLQQVMILVPLFVVILSLLQEGRRRAVKAR